MSGISKPSSFSSSRGFGADLCADASIFAGVCDGALADTTGFLVALGATVGLAAQVSIVGSVGDNTLSLNGA